MSSFNDLMPITPGWVDIGVRIAATLIAAVLLGINRERGGHPAGLRTTLLVGMAACLSSGWSSSRTRRDRYASLSRKPFAFRPG